MYLDIELFSDNGCIILIPRGFSLSVNKNKTNQYEINHTNLSHRSKGSKDNAVYVYSFLSHYNYTTVDSDMLQRRSATF